MVRRRDVKKSSFVSVDDSETTDYFDFIRNGQNLRISQSDLITALGLTGELQTLGEATGIPVLRVIGGVNYIRNIVGGAGINAAVSVQDGISISHNFTVDNTGVPVMIDEGSDSPTIRSIQAGSGISISGSGDVIQVSATAVPESSKTVIVYDISDFPTPVGDTITFEDDTEYKLQNDISSAYRYVMGSNSILSGADAHLIELEYTGSGNMITAADKSFEIKDIYLSCSSGTVFDVSSTTNLHTFRMYESQVLCDYVGNFDNMGLVYMRDVNFVTIYTQGITFSNNFGVAIFDTVGVTMPSGTGSAFVLGTATFTYFLIDKGIFNIDTTGYIASGLANSGNINAGGLGIMTTSRNFGTGADPPSDNIYPTDDRWESQHNSKLPDSEDFALGIHTGSTVNITAIGLANAVKVAATWTEQQAARFTVSSDGTFTFSGNQSYVSIDASITATPFTVEDNIAFVLYKNGAQVTDSVVYSTINATSPKNISLVWHDLVENGDYFELYTANIDANVDVVVTRVTMRIRS